MSSKKGSKWTEEEEKFLIENSEMPLIDVSEILGRGVGAIKWKRQELGLKREKIKNLVGKRFTRLGVTQENGRIRRRVAWLCKCDCGILVTVTSDHLHSGDTKSCGCYNREMASERIIKDLAGQRFGSLKVIKQNGRSKGQFVKWLCDCICNTKITVTSRNLLSGNTESCGCKRELNQRQGIAWEKLIKKFLKFRCENFLYHERLPNKKIPDFMTTDRNVILDAKRHDYLKIEECIKKYFPYCEK
jgi:hypothetical protein